MAFQYIQNYHGNEKKINWKLKRLQQGRIQNFQMEGYTGCFFFIGWSF